MQLDSKMRRWYTIQYLPPNVSSWASCYKSIYFDTYMKHEIVTELKIVLIQIYFILSANRTTSKLSVWTKDIYHANFYDLIYILVTHWWRLLETSFLTLTFGKVIISQIFLLFPMTFYSTSNICFGIDLWSDYVRNYN